MSSILSALIVDPDRDTRDMYAEYFERRRWRTSVAQDGADALALAVRERPNVITTELWLPRFDGLRLLAILRADPATTAIPVVVVTATATRAEIVRARAAGADIVLAKPCVPDFLFSAAARLIANRGPASDRTEAVSRPQPARAGDLDAEPAPTLGCPRCARQLVYDRSYRGGVNMHREQWDYYTCPAGCGRFCYRRRTRKMRRIG